MTQPDAFLFDMDGLLLDTEQAFLNAALTLLVPRGYDPAWVRSFFVALVGSSAAETRQDLAQRFGDQAEAFEAEWYALHQANMARHVPVKATVRDTLQHLAGQGARMAVVTSTRALYAHPKLEKAGLRGFFDCVVAGDEVPANKPDPTPYLQAARMLGVDPTRCAAFEDSDRGIEAAVRAGCLSVQIPDLRPPGKPFPQLGQMFADTLVEAVTQVHNRAILEGSP